MARSLISYDITPDKRRTKVARLLEGYGSRVQRSVFECDLSAQQYTQLRGRLGKLLRADDGDNVRMYALCAGCVRTIESIGAGTAEHTPDMYVV